MGYTQVNVGNVNHESKFLPNMLVENSVPLLALGCPAVCKVDNLGSSVHRDNTVRLWRIIDTIWHFKSSLENIIGATCALIIDHQNNITKIVVGMTYGDVCFYDYDETQQIWINGPKIPAHNENVTSLCLLQNDRLVSSGIDGYLVIWQLNTRGGVIIAKRKVHNEYIASVTRISDDKVLTASGDCTCKIVSVPNFTEEDRLVHDQPIIRAIFESESIFTLARDGKAHEWVSGGPESSQVV
jgi:WD40 repeat protein